LKLILPTDRTINKQNVTSLTQTAQTDASLFNHVSEAGLSEVQYAKHVSDCWQADGFEKETEGDLCWRARPRHGWSDQRMVSSSRATDIPTGIW